MAILSLWLLAGPMSRWAVGQATTQASYPDSSEGLIQFFNDMIAAAAASDRAAVEQMVQSMILPDPEKWFTHVFGVEKGPRLAQAYPQEVKYFPKNLMSVVMQLKPQETRLTVVRVESVDDPNARAYQKLALAAMKRPVPLYLLRINIEGARGSVTVWSIVHDEGRFRMVSKMRALTED